MNCKRCLVTIPLCDRNMQMRWQRRDIANVSRFAEASLSLMGEENTECIEGVETFKYLGWMLDRSDDNWLAVLRNVGKARRVWRRLGKLLSREGADPRVSAMFYSEVVQAVLLFGAENWILLVAMFRNMEGANVGFL